MGVNGVESELAHVSVENGKIESNFNGGTGINEPISFGAHGNGGVLVEKNKNLETNFPKDAVDEWPEEKKFHYVYFVKYRSVEDQNLKSKLDQADKDLTRLNQARNPITEKLRAQRSERAQVISQLKALGEERKHFRSIMDDKRKEIEPLQQALGKLRAPSNGNRDNRSFICSSEEELNDVIKSLQYRIQHESINLTEEKKIIREIKQLEGTRDKVIANAAIRAEIQKSVGEKDSIQDQVKLIGVGLDGVRKDQEAIKAKVKTLEAEKEAIDNVINSLEEELRLVTGKRDKVYEKIRELRNKREEGNSCFYQNRSLLNEARNLAANKDVNALKELSFAEVGKFISQWNISKSFREDYEKRILQSLDIRQLSKDGRMKNPEEKPLVSQAVPVETEVMMKLKEEPTLVSQQGAENGKNRKTQKEVDGKIKGIKDAEEEEVFGLEKKPVKTKEVDVAKLKEITREEEMAKAKQALERKKKLAEKAAAKAKIKAEKEAEKKLKEREKKAKKKMQAAPEPEEASMEVAAPAEAPEPEKAEENVKIEPKVSATRRRVRTKGPESISKVIFKRKKSTNYMYYYYAAAVATAIVALLAAIGYHIYA